MSFSYHMQWYVVTELSSVYEESPEGTKITSYCFMQILISVALPPSWRRKIFELFSNNLYWFLEQFYSNIIHKLNSLIKTQFNSIFFSIFTEWCKHHFYLVLECFCHPYKKTLIFFFFKKQRHFRSTQHLHSFSWACACSYSVFFCLPSSFIYV